MIMLQHALVEQFHSGHSLDAHHLFGAHFSYEGVNGVRFTVYAPHAHRVQVVGSFNDWGYPIEMHRATTGGIWSVFVSNVSEWAMYKYIIQKADGHWIEKADPYAISSEMRPKHASLVVNLKGYSWHDAIWLNRRSKGFQEAINIYELHLGSWKKKDGTTWLNYVEIARELVPYLKEMGYTHIEIMPVTEHPFDGSWGYQSHGYFSVTSRYGTPKQLMEFVDLLHQAEIGVIFDFVPVHFVRDAFGLAHFDGSPVYEYPNDHDANSQWGTLNFDLWREEVRSFLMSSANYWLETYHMDGLRVDAVSNIIFWHGNKQRGVNDGALAFIRRMNYYLNQRHPNVLLFAEDSSDFPKVTHSTYEMGLGFDYKWDLGWMNDTLKYYALDPIYRAFHHHSLTFSMAYFYSEKFVLPLSHDEVVHGKGTIINKMWGDYNQKFSQVKNLYLYMFAHPGKKLNFMGNELAHFREWDENRELDWFLLEYAKHAAFKRFMQDLNQIYRYHPCLSRYDYTQNGFRWIDADNASQSIYSFYREDEKSVILVLLNMTPIAYEGFRIGVPYEGNYVEIINSEKAIYDGCDMCNFQPVHSDAIHNHGYHHSINVRIAPFAAVYFEFTK